jgi:hypothetical protein
MLSVSQFPVAAVKHMCIQIADEEGLLKLERARTTSSEFLGNVPTKTADIPAEGKRTDGFSASSPVVAEPPVGAGRSRAASQSLHSPGAFTPASFGLVSKPTFMLGP